MRQAAVEKTEECSAVDPPAGADEAAFAEPLHGGVGLGRGDPCDGGEMRVGWGAFLASQDEGHENVLGF
jgi:hypothetical protein